MNKTDLSGLGLAYQIAVVKNIPHRFSSKWSGRFRLTERLYKEKFIYITSNSHSYIIIKKYNFESHPIWNVDESWFSTFPSQNPKVFSRNNDRKQVGVLTSVETGQHYMYNGLLR